MNLAATKIQTDFNKDFNSFSMYLGCSDNKYMTGSRVNNDHKEYEGSIRNLMIFGGSLTDEESESLFMTGLIDTADLPYEDNKIILTDLLNSGKFYLGLLGVYNVSSINILNCVMKYKGKSYSVKI